MKTYTYNDVLIKPKYSTLLTRSAVDIGYTMGNIHLSIPVISSNMKTITEDKMATEMARNGALGALHRFNSIEDAVDQFNRVKLDSIVSIGVNGDCYERFQALYDSGARYFCIDIAHGHNIMMESLIKKLKSEYNDIFLIAGNVATYEGAIDLINWGANGIKIGIGPGSVCQTRNNTGVGVPQLWALEQAALAKFRLNSDVTIIADGGIKSVGDIAKSYKFADVVMLGGMLSGTSETPGNVYKDPNDNFYKVYGGSASGENKGHNKFVEGMTTTVPFKGKVKYIIRGIKDGVQSAYSYVGASNTQEFKKKCEFISISGGGSNESKF